MSAGATLQKAHSPSTSSDVRKPERPKHWCSWCGETILSSFGRPSRHCSATCAQEEYDDAKARGATRTEIEGLRYILVRIKRKLGTRGDAVVL